LSRPALLHSTLLAAICLALAGAGASGAAQGEAPLLLFATDAGAKGNSQIGVMRADGSGFELLTHAAQQATSSAAFSPDGKRIAFPTDDGLWIARPDGSDAHRVGKVDGGLRLQWSPDGAKILLDSGRNILLVDVATGHSTSFPVVDSQTYVWAPDGKRFALSICRQTCSIWSVPVGAGKRRLLARSTRRGEFPILNSWAGGWIAYGVDSPNRAFHEVRAVRPDGRDDHRVATGFEYPVLSPDGTRIAMLREDAYWQLNGVSLVPTAGGKPQLVADLPGREVGTAWSGNGRSLLFLGGTKTRGPYAVRPGGRPVALTRRTWPHRVVGSPQWAPDGSGVIAGDEAMQLVLPNGARKVLFQERDDSGPVAAPDGRIAFERRAAADGSRPHVLVMGSDGTGITDLGEGSSPRWARDSSLAYVAAAGEVVVVTPNGAPHPTALHADVVAWSPDGRSLAYAQSRTLSRAKRDGSDAKLLARVPVSSCRWDDRPPVANDVAWSPDGRRIGFVEGMVCGWFLRLVDADGTHPRRVAVNYYECFLAWSPNGSRLAYSDESLYVANGGGSSAEVVTDVNGDRVGAYRVAWSPGGRLIAFSTNAGSGARIEVVAPGGGDPVPIGPDATNTDPSWVPGDRYSASDARA
jgi:Tol biopolymer transport system component